MNLLKKFAGAAGGGGGFPGMGAGGGFPGKILLNRIKKSCFPN